MKYLSFALLLLCSFIAKADEGGNNINVFGLVIGEKLNENITISISGNYRDRTVMLKKHPSGLPLSYKVKLNSDGKIFRITSLMKVKEFKKLNPQPRIMDAGSKMKDLLLDLNSNLSLPIKKQETSSQGSLHIGDRETDQTLLFSYRKGQFIKLIVSSESLDY